MPAKKTAGRFICVGYVQKPHALKGHVKAAFRYPFSGRKIKTLYIGDSSPLPHLVEQLQPLNKNLWLLKTAECNSRNDSEELTGKMIHIPLDDFDKYFEPGASALIGWKAVADGEELGTIEDVFVLPQQHLAQVTYRGKEVLIPLNDQTVHHADKKKKTVFLKLPDGLLDIQ